MKLNNIFNEIKQAQNDKTVNQESLEKLNRFVFLSVSDKYGISPNNSPDLIIGEGSAECNLKFVNKDNILDLQFNAETEVILGNEVIYSFLAFEEDHKILFNCYGKFMFNYKYDYIPTTIINFISIFHRGK